MGTTPTHGRFARYWDAKWSIAPIAISIIEWSKIIGGVKQRSYPMRGFGNFGAAARFCQAYDEQRDYFRARRKAKKRVSLAEQRQLFRQRFAALQDWCIAA